MSAALAVIRVIEEEDLRTNATVVGAYLRQRLEELKDKYSAIGDVRGLGLMQGLELVKDRETKEPAPQTVAKVFEETKRQRVLIGKGGLYGNVIRTGLMLNSTERSCRRDGRGARCRLCIAELTMSTTELPLTTIVRGFCSRS